MNNYFKKLGNYNNINYNFLLLYKKKKKFKLLIDHKRNLSYLIKIKMFN